MSGIGIQLGLCDRQVETMRGGHFHHCPNCYRAMPCEMECSIEPDLASEGRLFGAHARCNDCGSEEPTPDPHARCHAIETAAQALAEQVMKMWPDGISIEAGREERHLNELAIRLLGEIGDIARQNATDACGEASSPR